MARYTVSGSIGLDPDVPIPNVYHLSGHVAQSNCWGLCGSMGRDNSFEWRMTHPNGTTHVDTTDGHS